MIGAGAALQIEIVDMCKAVLDEFNLNTAGHDEYTA